MKKVVTVLIIIGVSVVLIPVISIVNDLVNPPEDDKIIEEINSHAKTLGWTDEELTQSLKDQGYTDQEIKLFKAKRRYLKARESLIEETSNNK